MGFLSLAIALLLEQVRPLASDNVIYRALRAGAHWLEKHLNAGESEHGLIAWLLLVVPVVGLAWAVFGWCLHAHRPIGELAWNVAILYLTLGFRRFSHTYTAIEGALANRDVARARQLLLEWQGARLSPLAAADFGPEELSRSAIEEALVASHRHVFGVLFWFVVLPGPSGAVLYRMADELACAWNRSPGELFGRFACQAFAMLDWIPVRLTAVGFAIVGNFEDAVFAWRSYAQRFTDPSRGVLLASGSGALGVRLGDRSQLRDAGRDDLGVPADSLPERESSPEAMRSAVGLVFRSLVLWMLLLFLMWLPGVVG